MLEKPDPEKLAAATAAFTDLIDAGRKHASAESERLTRNAGLERSAKIDLQRSLNERDREFGMLAHQRPAKTHAAATASQRTP